MIRKVHLITLLALEMVFLFCVLSVNAQESYRYPAWCMTKTNLNIRATDNAYGRKITTVQAGTKLMVRKVGYNGWAEIEYNGRTAYCANRYLTYWEPLEKENKTATHAQSAKTDSSFNLGTLLLWTLYFIILCFVLALLRKILLVVLGFLGKLFYKCYIIISLPFYFLNWLQRFLAKPWFLNYKQNSGLDYKNAQLRENYELWQMPLYVILTPLRFVNAIYYNLVIHCSFELFNYLVEVVVPTKDNEGGDYYLLWVAMLPWRILKYLIWHGSLTLIESCIWTIIDTILPALTLFHGTDCSAAESITQGPGRVCSRSWYSGIWNVGGGNYAGNGIYFAPKRATALHYSAGSLIVCRVSLGRTLDLGLAPKRIYDLCGHPNALGVTEWGLKNGYVTGEWWRGDQGWWEYCMYDWQNRYNDSWRIRPIYVLNLNEECIQRIPGGMYHWFFQKMVLKDFGDYLDKQMSK